jgi:tetratricopeptide (TPR) repeat protein
VFADAYYNLGVSLFENAYREAVRYDPEEAEAGPAAIASFNARTLDRYDNAIETLEEAIRLYEADGNFERVEEINIYIQDTIMPMTMTPPVNPNPEAEAEDVDIPVTPAPARPIPEPIPIPEPAPVEPESSFPSFPESETQGSVFNDALPPRR